MSTSPLIPHFLLMLSLFSATKLSEIYTFSNETTIPTKETPFPKINLNTGNLFIGSGNEKSVSISSFLFDFQKPSSIIGEINESGWGVNCASSEKDSTNSCVYNPKEQAKSDVYRGNSYNYLSADAYVKIENQNKIAMGKKMIF